MGFNDYGLKLQGDTPVIPMEEKVALGVPQKDKHTNERSLTEDGGDVGGEKDRGRGEQSSVLEHRVVVIGISQSDG